MHFDEKIEASQMAILGNLKRIIYVQHCKIYNIVDIYGLHC